MVLTLAEVERILAELRATGVEINEKREALIRRDLVQILKEEHSPARQIAMLQSEQAGYEGPIHFFYRALEGWLLAQNPGLLMDPGNWPILQLSKTRHGDFATVLARKRGYLLAGEVNENATLIDCGTDATEVIRADLAEIGLGFHAIEW